MNERTLDIIEDALYELTARVRAPLVAIDGRCASGKTTLAACLQKRLDCNVIHMDDFFLRPSQRSADRLRQPGGNVDWERFSEEVLRPFRAGEPFSYRPYDCHTRSFSPSVRLSPDRLTLVEGAYCCHPELWESYDLHVFLSVSPAEQLRRISARNGPEGLELFVKRWIPLEEMYFEALKIPQKCELYLESERFEA